MKLIKHLTLLIFLVILISSCKPADNPVNQESADLILTGVKIFTSNPQQPWAEAVAIRNGKFLYVGDSAGASVYSSENTRSFVLDGQLVIPGLVDSHAHRV